MSDDGTRRAVSRRGFFAALVGRGEASGARPARPIPPAAPALQGLVPAGETFSLEAFYRARAEARAHDEGGEPR